MPDVPLHVFVHVACTLISWDRFILQIFFFCVGECRHRSNYRHKNDGAKKKHIAYWTRYPCTHATHFFDLTGSHFDFSCADNKSANNDLVASRPNYYYFYSQLPIVSDDMIFQFKFSQTCHIPACHAPYCGIHQLNALHEWTK